VTLSRGYRRLSLVPDGGFDGYICDDGGIFCYATAYDSWVGTSPHLGTLDATIFSWAPYAHYGQGSGLLGSATGVDAFAGTLAPAKPLMTVSGRRYKIEFFHSSSYSGNIAEREAYVQVVWNGDVVATIRPGYSGWMCYVFEVTGCGRDMLAFTGGEAPAWSFIDDVKVFAM